jgi:hypothetical protein
MSSSFYLRQCHTPNLCIISDSSCAERFHVQGTSILSHNILFLVPALCHQQCWLFRCICMTWHWSMASFNLQSGAPETAASRSYLHATVSWLLGWFGLLKCSCTFQLFPLVVWGEPIATSTGGETLHGALVLVPPCAAQASPPASFHRCLLGPCDVSISPWWEVFLPCVHTSPLGILWDDVALALTLAMRHLSQDLL